MEEVQMKCPEKLLSDVHMNVQKKCYHDCGYKFCLGVCCFLFIVLNALVSLH